MNTKQTLALLTLIALSTAACAPAATGPAAGAAVSEQPPVASRTLRIGVRVEPASLARNPLREGQTTLDAVRRLFNAELALIDETGTARPFLAAELPQLNTDTWRVLPDGRMQTTYRLRPGLMWHDGAPLTAEDFVFGWRVIATPALGQAGLIPQKLMEEIVAPDPQTVVIHWTQPFPDAGILNITFSPLPAHVLQPAYEQQSMDAFASHPFWATAFVGVGPYRLTRWEPAAFIEGDAFPAYVLGVPKIDRIRLTFVPDPNGALTRLFADDVDLVADSGLKSQQLPALEQDWIARGAGNVVLQPNSYRAAHFQLRPERASPNALLDVRVRRALAYAIDKQAVNEGVYRGAAILATSPFPPWSYAGQPDQAAITYPHDVRRAAQLMEEAGFARGPDGVFVHPTQGRFSGELRTNASDQFETEMHVAGDTWRRAGFDFTEAITPPALVQDSQTRATFSGVYIFGAGGWESALRGYSSSLIPTAENRWSGGNRGAWRNSDWDRLAVAYDATLDPALRAQVAAQMARLYTEELPSIPMEFDPDVIAYTTALTGPRGGPREATVWNIYEWELR
jgi:peptide/nickel transport system substrate-binding protein